MPRYPNLDRSILEVALTALENRKADLDALIESARRQLGTRFAGKTAGFSVPELSVLPAAPLRRKGRRKRVMSAEARARIAEAQRLRWAASRKQAGGARAAGAKAKPAAKRRTMSPEARKRIAEAQRKRWAAVKKAT
jgi:hypothetical protein